MTQRASIGTGIGLMLLAVYAAPLFVPPPASWTLPSLDAGLWQRVFPGGFSAWVLWRLLALFAGALLIVGARWREAAPLPSLLRHDAAVSAQPSSRRTRIALTLAVLQAISGWFAGSFPRWLEILYFFALGLPALILVAGEIPAWRRTLVAQPRRIALLLAVPLLWSAIVAPVAWRS
ncbi:MAG TPA: hypothetical protein VEB21_01165, partial [Terriglobales bacterium]|nr:hypothetical protein [Terriglobales bacterium]